MTDPDVAIRGFGARDTIGRVIALYGQLLDSHRWVEFGELFTKDGIWRTPSVTLETRGAIVEGLRGMQGPRPGTVKHLSFTPVIDVESGTRARAWTDFLVVHCPGESWNVVSAGRYHDLLVFEDPRWRFARREADVWPPDDEPLTDVPATPGH
jgi:hypothetical protein